MDKMLNQSYSNRTSEGYPVLRLGYADVTLIGRWDGLSHALYSLHEDGLFWVQYNRENQAIEMYTLLDGDVELEYDGERRSMEVGEVIDASQYDHVISFYGKTAAEFLIKMSAERFEDGYFEAQLLQEEADAVAAIDGYTYMHCNWIKDYSIEVWKRLHLPTESLSTLRWGAYFHDVGKRTVPVEILNKPGKLTGEEWEIMKSHTTEGAKIMREHSVEWLKDTAHIVEQHHERHDGKGYPYGLNGNEISLEAAIVLVVDAFDAMTTDRAYKEAYPIQVAVEELKAGKGTQFNPEVVDAFIEILENNQFKWK